MKNEGERGGKMKGRKNQKKAKMKKWSEKGWGVRTEELPGVSAPKKDQTENHWIKYR